MESEKSTRSFTYILQNDLFAHDICHIMDNIGECKKNIDIVGTFAARFLGKKKFTYTTTIVSTNLDESICDAPLETSSAMVKFNLLCQYIDMIEPHHKPEEIEKILCNPFLKINIEVHISKHVKVILRDSDEGFKKICSGITIFPLETETRRKSKKLSEHIKKLISNVKIYSDIKYKDDTCVVCLMENTKCILGESLCVRKCKSSLCEKCFSEMSYREHRCVICKTDYDMSFNFKTLAKSSN